jgi:hypothetical protein
MRFGWRGTAMQVSNFGLGNIEFTASILYALNPIGIETPYVESLTSYIIRLSNEHSLGVSNIITGVIAPLIEGNYLESTNKQGGNRFYERSSSLNGLTSLPNQFVTSLERLTMIKGLPNLTMLKFKHFLPPRELMHFKKRWCPLCYSERFNKDILYDPLLWSLKAVNVCIVLNIQLEFFCPHCQRELFPMARNAQIGYCNRCGGWLGKSGDSINKLHAEQEYHLSIAKKIGEIIAQAPLLNDPNKDSLKKFFSKLLSYHFITSNELARSVNIPLNTFRHRCNGDRTPPLGMLAHIAYMLKISILDIINENFDRIVTMSLPKQSTNSKVNRRVFTRKGTIDKPQLEENLRRILYYREPIPINQAAKELGMHKRNLYNHFPELCYQISTRYKQHQGYINERKRILLYESMKKIVVELIFQKKYPGMLAVTKALKEQGIPTASNYYQRETLKQVLRELRVLA